MKKIRTQIVSEIDGLDRIRQSRLERVPDVWDISGYNSVCEDDYGDDPEYREVVNKISEITLYDQLRHRGW